MDLKKYIPDYSKGRLGTFSELEPQLDFALANARRALEQATTNHTDNPSTTIHDLVEHLRDLKG